MYTLSQLDYDSLPDQLCWVITAIKNHNTPFHSAISLIACKLRVHVHVDVHAHVGDKARHISIRAAVSLLAPKLFAMATQTNSMLASPSPNGWKKELYIQSQSCVKISLH